MKHLLLTLLGTALAGIVCAQEPTEKAPIVLKTYAEYGYNNTWEHFGHIAVGGYFPINTYFDLQAGIDLCTANSYAIDGRATVRFPLRVGQLALDNRLLYRAIVCSRTHEACAALSLGYRMDYFAISIGAFSRFYSVMPTEHHIQTVEFVVSSLNQAVHVCPDGNIADLAVAVLCTKLCRNFCELIIMACTNHDFTAITDKLSGNRQANAGSAAGNNSDLSRKSPRMIHNYQPFLSSIAD